MRTVSLDEIGLIDYKLQDDGGIVIPSGRVRRGSAQGHDGSLCLKLKPTPDQPPIRVVPHQLVALYFVPNPNEWEFIRHKDGNKRNNHYTNLKWVPNARAK